ncbi:hypothetical protein [Streptomyces goshikiensis]|uniref:hypothetical protein n=1 Tax=Streptomyces goshikiensis TaxID=1942 RepID=UPI003646DFD2
MPRNNKIARLAELLAFTTGWSYQRAQQHVTRLAPTAPLIPEANFQQALLERRVFEGLAWTPRSKVHPWGITRVLGTPNHLDLALEPTPNMATDLAELLPRSGECGLKGIPGGRLLRADDSGITLGVLNTTATVTFTGITMRRWNRALATTDAEALNCGETLCFRTHPRSWAPEEIDAYPPYRDKAPLGRMNAESAWLVSGVLRRTPIVHALGVILHTSAWYNPNRPAGEHWILDLQHEAPDRPEVHDRLVHALMHPRIGLGLAPVDHYCTCGTPWSHACQTDLAATDGRPGRLQLRFNRLSRVKRELWQERPQALAAREEVWEEKQLPTALATAGIRR